MKFFTSRYIVKFCYFVTSNYLKPYEDMIQIWLNIFSAMLQMIVLLNAMMSTEIVNSFAILFSSWLWRLINCRLGQLHYCEMCFAVIMVGGMV